ncbi:forkhead box protein R2 [Mastomys coucha]|uniref:forkhead box protein R2 n=1 Tax=Mastomys coucha TaxID=35658 RepID=UPI00126217F9|nr:forkhead box protein R2 [Mastomys coucha]
MDIKVKNRDFWFSLHGQVPGMLDWDMGNEFFLPCTTDQCSFAEQSLAKYKIQLIKPPALPQKKKSSFDNDGPPTEPSLWMWVNPNIVCPINSKSDSYPIPKLVVSAPHTGESDFLVTHTVVQSLPVFYTEHHQQQKLPVYSTAPDAREKGIKEQACTSSKKHSKKNTVCHAPHREESWPRPPLNYSHLVALALKSSPSCGLNVQQIYNFTRQHFPYFRTAPDGWKNTIRHNLCSLTCFEKVPIDHEDELEGKPRSFLWKLTDEGNRFFQEDTRILAYARRESIKQSMRQPELIDLLFHL